MITCYSKIESGIGISLIWILQASDLNVCCHWVPQRATSDPARPRTSNTCHHPAVRFIVSAVLENSQRWGPTFSSFLYNPQGLKRYQHILVSQSIITEWFSDWKFNMSPHFSSFLENWLWHFILMLRVYCWSQHTVTRPHTPETPHFTNHCHQYPPPLHFPRVMWCQALFIKYAWKQIMQIRKNQQIWFWSNFMLTYNFSWA